VRPPAGWCGIFALKPSFGRVPIDPPYIGRVAGPMTRARARPDNRDYMSLPHADIAWTAPHLDVRGLRVGLTMEPGCGMLIDPEIAA
jgi:aspartyl-tRNA(Asn)/glutamyl-tRNA(Gln) amidotransferase subunit A